MNDLELLGINSDLIETMTPSEKSALINIISEMKDGNTELYSNILSKDYDEVPVDIDTFIEDERYLGKVTKKGSTIYPYWRRALRKIFDPASSYTEVIFSGAIGLGKTTIAVTSMSYILYKLLCLKDPQEFYGLQGNSEIVLAFFNVNLDLSYGVAYKKMQSILMNSPWFLEHGSIVGRKEDNKRYVPDKNIRFRVGSQETHGLGQDIFCLKGNTLIKTTDGVERIDNLENKLIQVYSEDEGEEVVSNLCTVKKTKEVNELYRIKLEDGSIIECTGDHKLKLTNGEYKCVKDLKNDDELLCI